MSFLIRMAAIIVLIVSCPAIVSATIIKPQEKHTFTVDPIWPTGDYVVSYSHIFKTILQCNIDGQPSSECICEYHLWPKREANAPSFNGRMDFSRLTMRYEKNIPLNYSTLWGFRFSCAYANQVKLFEGRVEARITPVIENGLLQPPLPSDENSVTYVSNPVNFDVLYTEESQPGIYDTFNDGRCTVNYSPVRYDFDGQETPMYSAELIPEENQSHDWAYKKSLSIPEGIYYIHFLCQSGKGGLATSETYPIMVGPPSL